MKESRFRKLSGDKLSFSKKRTIRYLITYTMILLLVIGYYWLNRESAQVEIPVSSSHKVIKPSTTFSLEPPKPVLPDK